MGVESYTYIGPYVLVYNVFTVESEPPICRKSPKPDTCDISQGLTTGFCRVCGLELKPSDKKGKAIKFFPERDMNQKFSSTDWYGPISGQKFQDGEKFAEVFIPNVKWHDEKEIKGDLLGDGRFDGSGSGVFSFDDKKVPELMSKFSDFFKKELEMFLSYYGAYELHYGVVCYAS